MVLQHNCIAQDSLVLGASTDFVKPAKETILALKPFPKHNNYSSKKEKGGKVVREMSPHVYA